MDRENRPNRTASRSSGWIIDVVVVLFLVVLVAAVIGFGMSKVVPDHPRDAKPATTSAR